ncbi:MAG: ATPase domain-containing protein [Desulfuromonadaceae bacterium]
MNSKAVITRLATGVPGLDAILGGGLPEFSFNIIMGPPGSGKTTLAHQIMFSLATREKPALFFTVLGEPPLKMLRYQQQFHFFDLEKINESIRFVNLNNEFEEGNLEQVLARMSQEIEAYSPALVFVDSFRSALAATQPQTSNTINQQQFVQQLATQLSGWQATTFLVGEYLSESDLNPVFTVADGLMTLEQSVFRNSVVRKIQLLKMRGQAIRPGRHTFRITSAGIEIFPAALINDDNVTSPTLSGSSRSKTRLTTGIPHLDDMLGGGLPSGYSLLVAGPSGSGKTILATAFLAEGVRRGEPGIIVAFEQTPSQSWVHTLHDLVSTGQIGLINTRSLDLSIDEIVQHLTTLIHKMKATRVVIDSLSGFELAVAPAFREDFRESLFRMFAVLSGLGVTVLMTSELEDRYIDLRFSPYGSAFLTDAIIVQRYIEVASRLQRVISVVKVRASAHSTEIRRFDITDDGIVIGDPIFDYEGILGGQPTRVKVATRSAEGEQS